MTQIKHLEEQLFELRKFVHGDIEATPYYFRDGVTKVHYIIVIHDDAIFKPAYLKRVLEFLNILEEQGLKFEFETGYLADRLEFLKVSLSDQATKNLANLYDIDIDNTGHNYVPESFGFRFRRTRLTANHGDVFKRKPGIATSCEKISLIMKVLSDPHLYEKKIYSMEKMIKLGYIHDSFPVHDGPWKNGQRRQDMNDRQLLAKYWACYGMWYKEQPINLIAKYYGTEVAFYFAWMGFYNQMLLSAAFVGLIILLFHAMLLTFYTPNEVLQTCDKNNTIIICPLCEDDTICQFVPFSNYCGTTAVTYVLDNYSTIFHAIFISLWDFPASYEYEQNNIAYFEERRNNGDASYLLEKWKRQEQVLRVRWNVTDSDVDQIIRYDFIDKSNFRVHSGKKVPFLPYRVKIIRYAFTSFICILTVIMVSSYELFLILLRLLLVRAFKIGEPTRLLLSTWMCAVFQVFFIKIFSSYYLRMGVWLTQIEVPRTQQNFDDNVIYKIYFFGFVTNYIPMLYTAFVRGRFFRVPGRGKHDHILQMDYCLPSGCTMSLCIQLVTVLVLKSGGGNLGTAIMLRVKRILLRQLGVKKIGTAYALPSWETEYFLAFSNRELLTCEFADLLIQFGYVSFFMAAFPLAPLCALVNNMYELRADAIKLVKHHRRIVPSMVKGIGAWIDVLRFASFASIVCNVCIVAFTTNVIPLIGHDWGGMRFSNFLLSVFDTNDYTKPPPINITVCSYPGLRHPPDHPEKYRLTDEHHMVLLWRLIFVILAEHIIIAIIGAIYYFLSGMPGTVKEQLHKEHDLTVDLKEQMRLQKEKESKHSLNMEPNEDM